MQMSRAAVVRVPGLPEKLTKMPRFRDTGHDHFRLQLGMENAMVLDGRISQQEYSSVSGSKATASPASLATLNTRLRSAGPTGFVRLLWTGRFSGRIGGRFGCQINWRWV
jgi:hypothetical protein